MTAAVDAAGLKAMLGEGDELALLDLREEGPHSEAGHPLYAASLPLSRLELGVLAAVPRTSARVVLMDGGGEGLAERGRR